MPAPQGEERARRDGALEIVERSDPPLTAGSCVLRRPEVAVIVQDAIMHFEGERYSLQAWCVMPNHVHVVMQPLGGLELEDIEHSWKSYTSSKINRLQKRKGTLWERECFDHLVRSAEELERFVFYVENNPVAAGFVNDPKEWRFSSCGAGFQPASVVFADPGQSPFVAPRTRGELPHLHKEGGVYFLTWRLLDAVVLRG